ncbi:MAG: hypothetical protein FJY88_01585 [Candidatus Eisenbacteria bacterium]|nr:hypothetical protein [Candidatus Eisenbacteria bacterium]
MRPGGPALIRLLGAIIVGVLILAVAARWSARPARAHARSGDLRREAPATDSETGIGLQEELRIDLSDQDPDRLDDLPGILDLETDALSGVAGPGSESLGDRLRASGIDPRRLREWAPYLRVSSSGDTRASWLIRSTHRVSGSAMTSSQTHLRGERSPLRLEIVVRHQASRSSAASARDAAYGAAPEARLSCRLNDHSVLWGGSLAGGLVGPDPWDDPLRRWQAPVPFTSAVRVSPKRTARGLLFQGKPLSAGAWSDENAGIGAAVSCEIASAGGWLGYSEKLGRGCGARLAARGVALAGSASLPSGHAPVLALGLSSERSRARLAGAWSLGDRADGRTGLVEGRLTRSIGSMESRIEVAARGSADGRAGQTRWTSSLRGPLLPGFLIAEISRGGTTLNLRGTWERSWTDDRSRSIASPRSESDAVGSGDSILTGRGIPIAGRAPQRISAIKLQLRATRDRARSGVLLGAGGQAVAGGCRLHASVFGRTSTVVGWPGSAGGTTPMPWLCRLEIRIPGRAGGIRLAASLPLAFKHRARTGPPIFDLSIEQRQERR